MKASTQFQNKMQEQVLAMWPDKLPPQLAGRSREELQKMMKEVALLMQLSEADLPANLPDVHRFFVEFGRRRYRDFLQMGQMLIRVQGGKSDAEFRPWLEKHVPAGQREEAELAMRAVREGG